MPQGRHFIGVLHLLLLSMCIIAGGSRSHRTRLRQTACWVPAVFGLLGLFFSVAGPLAYVRNTSEYLVRSKLPSVIESQLEIDGFRKLSIQKAWPQQLRGDGFVDRPPSRLPEFYRLHWAKSTLGGEIESGSEKTDHMEIVVWVRGDRVRGADTELGIGLCPPSPEGLPGPNWILGSVRADRRIETYRLSINLEQVTSEATFLYVQLMNYDVAARGFLPRCCTTLRSADVFGVYYRFVP